MDLRRLLHCLLSSSALATASVALSAACSASDSVSAPPAPDSGTGASDGSSRFDAGAGDVEVADTNACQPGDISDFKPIWKMPTPFHQGACEPSQWETFYRACLGASADKQECAKFTSPTGELAKCGQCIATADTADRYGPLLVHSGWVELNVPGCLANAMNDPTGVRCAASVQAAHQCELAACGANCPVTSEGELNLFNACGAAADGSLCKSYVDAATCLEQTPDAGTLGVCVEEGDFKTRFLDLVELFCGGSVDAGAVRD